MLFQSELNIPSVVARLLQMILQVFSPPNKSKDNTTNTVPVCSVAQGEGASQKPQIEDSLWEIQHPGIAAHKVILWEQGRGIKTPSGSLLILMAKCYWNCIAPGGKGKFKYACPTTSSSGPEKCSHSKHSSSYYEDGERELLLAKRILHCIISCPDMGSKLLFCKLNTLPRQSHDFL